MAINLWGLGGQPTSFNPLSTGWTTLNTPLNIGEYKVIFKAKSPTNATIEFLSFDGSKKLYSYLTTELKEYEITFQNTKELKYSFNDLNDNGDIIIQDIQLVRKPLGQATLNGISDEIDKWVNMGIASNNGSEDANPTRLRSEFIAVKPNTEYTFSLQSGYDVYFFEYTDTTYVKGNGWGVNTVKTSPTTKRLKFLVRNIYNTDIAPSEIKNVKPMLVLGSQPIPYEKKRGDRMVMPVVKKNLFNKENVTKSMFIYTDGSLAVSGSNNNASEFIPVKPNTTYTLTGNKGYQHRVSFYGVDKNHISHHFTDSTLGEVVYSITSPSNAYFIRLSINDLGLDTYQLEQGATATPYEPYAVQVNKKARGLVPVKNFFDKRQHAFVIGVGSSGDGTINTTNLIGMVTKNIVPVNPNTQYIYSIEAGFSRVTPYAYGKFGNYLGNEKRPLLTGPPEVGMFTTPPDCYFIRLQFNKSGNVLQSEVDKANEGFQLEQGSTVTPFEPYKLSNPKAKQGLVMDGRTNYIQLPSMTMDSIEIDCLIDSKSSMLFDSRFGAIWGNAWCRVESGGTLSGYNGATIEGEWFLGERSKIKVTMPTTTNSFRLMANVITPTGEFAKGIVYGIECYLNGQVVASYNAENLQSIQGNTLYDTSKAQAPVNLLPSFDRGLWGLHPNLKVYGERVGQHNAIASWEKSHYILDIEPTSKYKIKSDGKGRLYVRYGESVNGTVLNAVSNGGEFEFGPSGQTKLTVTLETPTSGSHDFINPTLIKVPIGNHGTINGTVQPLQKKAKRVLFAKR